MPALGLGLSQAVSGAEAGAAACGEDDEVGACDGLDNDCDGAIDEDYQRALAANATDPTETIDALQVFGLIAHSLPDWDMKRTHAIMESIGAHNGDAVLMHEWIRSKHQHAVVLDEHLPQERTTRGDGGGGGKGQRRGRRSREKVGAGKGTPAT